MEIGLIQVDGKLPNLALMKISTYFKSLGAKVEFAKPNKMYDKTYAAVLFTWNKEKALQLHNQYQNLTIGGTGYDLTSTLPPEIESCRPDYNLYTVDTVYQMIKHGIRTKESTLKKATQIVNMGIGFSSRGCIRDCGFCVVRKKEGLLHQENTISEIVNPNSNLITLYDNNLTADPEVITKLHEIRDRNLIVDISQGIDIRTITDEIAQALSEVKHMRSLHFAWDLMSFEASIMQGIQILSKYIKPYRQMCFVLVGYNTSHEEDMHRVQKLASMGIAPYVMKYNNRSDDLYLNHFARWINGRFYKTCTFEEYTPWLKSKPTNCTMDDLFQKCV